MLVFQLMMSEYYVSCNRFAGFPDLPNFADSISSCFVFNLVSVPPVGGGDHVSGAMQSAQNSQHTVIYSAIISLVILPVEPVGFGIRKAGSSTRYIEFRRFLRIHMVGGITAFIGARSWAAHR
jgi:hypothetical protein